MAGRFGPAPTTYAQYGQYGAAPQFYPASKAAREFGSISPSSAPRKSWNIVSIIISFLLPVGIFAAVFAVLSFPIPGNDFWEPTGFCTIVCVVCFVPVAWLGLSTFQTLVKRAEGVQQETSWITFLFCTALLAWVLGMALGSTNYKYNTAPYTQIASLKSYSGIDPGRTLGMQVLDAGSISFTSDAHLDLSKSMGFKSGSVYCAAPIVSSSTHMTYDFWAVGLDCCSDGNSDFHCGDYKNPKARAGLRVWRDSDLGTYKSAVQEAMAVHKINSQNAILLTWMEDPATEYRAYKNDSVRCFCLGIYIYIIVHFFCVLLTIAVGKISKW